MNEKINVRARVKELLEKKENSDFFKSLYESGSGLTPAQNITAPEDIEELIHELVYERSKLYRLLDVRRIYGDETISVLSTKGKSVFSFGDSCSRSIPLGKPEKEEVSLTSKKMSGYFSICNAVLEDSPFETAVYLVDTLSNLLSNSIDVSIIDGRGIDGAFKNSQVFDTGRINYDSLENMCRFIRSKGGYPTVVVDRDVFNDFIFSRKTQVEEQDDKVNVFQLGAKYDGEDIIMPEGYRIVFVKYSETLKKGFVVIGDFSKYIFAERTGIEFKKDESSGLFINGTNFMIDGTDFMFRYRADGKITHKDLFISLKAPVEEEPEAPVEEEPEILPDNQ